MTRHRQPWECRSFQPKKRASGRAQGTVSTRATEQDWKGSPPDLSPTTGMPVRRRQPTLHSVAPLYTRTPDIW